MESSKDRHGGHGDQFMDRFQRAKASLTGAWRCRVREGDVVSPSPRTRRQKREKARQKGEHENPLLNGVSQPTPAKQSSRLSLEALSLESWPREGHSKKDSPANRGKTNGQLQPDQDELKPRSVNGGSLEKANTGLDTVLLESNRLQDLDGEIVPVGDENESHTSILTTPKMDAQHTDPLKTGSSKQLEFGQNTKAVNAGSLQDVVERLDRPSADYQSAASPSSEIEEVGAMSNTLNSASETPREAEERRVVEDKHLHHSMDGVSEEKVQHGIDRSDSPHDQCTESKESSAMGKSGQNIVLPYSDRSGILQEAEGELLKGSEQHESPVSVLSGPLGSARWADFDAANNVPHSRANTKREIEQLERSSSDQLTVFSEGKHNIAEAGKGLDILQSEDDGLQEREHETATSKNETDADDSLRDTPGKKVESGVLKYESSENLEQASKDETEEHLKDTSKHSESQSNCQVTGLAESCKLGGTEEKMGSSSRAESDNLQAQMDSEVEDREQTLEEDHGMKAFKASQDGTHDPYNNDRGGSESAKSYGIAAEEKDDRASMYGTGYYLRYFVLGVAVVIAVSFLHYRQTLW